MIKMHNIYIPLGINYNSINIKYLCWFLVSSSLLLVLLRLLVLVCCSSISKIKLPCVIT